MRSYHKQPRRRASETRKLSVLVHGTTRLCMVTSKRPDSVSSEPASRYSDPGHEWKSTMISAEWTSCSCPCSCTKKKKTLLVISNSILWKIIQQTWRHYTLEISLNTKASIADSSRYSHLNLFLDFVHIKKIAYLYPAKPQIQYSLTTSPSIWSLYII